MTTITDAVRMTSGDYKLLTEHGYTGLDRMAEMVRLLPAMDLMERNGEQRVRVLYGRLEQLQDPLLGPAALESALGVIRMLRHTFGDDNIHVDVTRKARYKVTVGIKPTTPANKLETLADIIA